MLERRYNTGVGLTRRALVRLLGLGLLAGCSPLAPAAPVAPTPPEATRPPTAPVAPAQAGPTSPPALAPAPPKYNQAPALAQLVRTGTLAPVEQRLPANPQVVQPIQGVGQYGGTWRLAWTGPADFRAYAGENYDPMLRWPRDPKDPVQPGLAEKWEFNSDGTELTLTLRKGLKWSDGQPFTTDDILFWWNDIALDTNITPAPPPEWVINGKPMTMEATSPEVIKLKFGGTNGMALRMLAFHGNQWPLNFERFGFYAPRHYLSQYHPRLNNGANDYQVFNDRADDLTPPRPVMTAWVVTSWAPGDRQLTAERNPYYWRVDTQGNQLPYIDRLRLDRVEDSEALNLKGVNGELDMQFRRIEFGMYSAFQDNMQKGNYRVLHWNDASGSPVSFFVNQTYPDPDLRRVFSDLRFRQALSYAINRKQINAISYFGLGKERNALLIPESPYYSPEIEAMFTEFAPDRANQLLDEVGLQNRGDGFRSLSSGQPFDLMVETTETSGANFDAIQLVRKGWENIGIRTVVKSSERSVFWTRATSNQVQIAEWGTDRGLEPFVDPIYLFPYDERSWMAPAYGAWFRTGGLKGEKPEGSLALAQDLFNQFKATLDPSQQIALGKQIVKLAHENLWTIETVGALPSIPIVKNTMANVPDQAVTDWIFMSPGNLDPAQFYFKG